MHNKFVDALRWIMWPQAAAAYVFTIRQQKYWPVLDSVLTLEFNVFAQEFVHLPAGELAPDINEPHYLRISPKRDC